MVYLYKHRAPPPRGLAAMRCGIEPSSYDLCRRGGKNRLDQQSLRGPAGCSAQSQPFHQRTGGRSWHRDLPALLPRHVPDCGGRGFVGHAKRLLAQINAVENLYKNGRAAHQKFSVSAPPAAYLSAAFVRFAAETGAVPGELRFSETIASQVISRVSLGEDNFGIVRYALPYGEHFQRVFEDKDLKSETIAEFRYVLLLSKDSPLSDGRPLWRTDLSELFEIVGTDPLAPMAAAAAPAEDSFPTRSRRHIAAVDPIARFAILRERRDAFLWSLPLPAETLARNGLVSRECVDCKKRCRDVLIYRKDYHLDAVDQRFVETLRHAGAQLGSS